MSKMLKSFAEHIFNIILVTCVSFDCYCILSHIFDCIDNFHCFCFVTVVINYNIHAFFCKS